MPEVEAAILLKFSSFQNSVGYGVGDQVSRGLREASMIRVCWGKG